MPTLKELAEAALLTDAGSRPWTADGEAGHWGVIHGPPNDPADCFDLFEAPGEAIARFVAAANPFDVLGLIRQLEAYEAAAAGMIDRPHSRGWCQWCGWTGPFVPRGEAQLHVASCGRHPIRAVEAERDKLRAAIQKAGFSVMETSGEWSIHDVSELAQKRAAADDAKTTTVINENIKLLQQVQRLEAARGTMRTAQQTSAEASRDDAWKGLFDIAEALDVQSPARSGESASDSWVRLTREILAKAKSIYTAIVYCHSQHADDRCWMDPLKIYEAAGLPPPDTSVGDKPAMKKNCDRFIDNYCTGGSWATYAELELKVRELAARLPEEKP